MPFADDVRKYPFSSLDRLVNKKGQVVTKHPYIPTEEQCSAMEDFVDAMDLMEAGDKDDEGYVRIQLSHLIDYALRIHIDDKLYLYIYGF